MKTYPRPMSPHLQVYKLHTKVTSLPSITFRVFGAVLMTVGTFCFLLWLGSAAWGPEAYDAIAAFFGSWFGVAMLVGGTVVLVFHLVNGIRHLLWDMGVGFEMSVLRKTAWAALFVTAVLCVLAWYLGFAQFNAVS
ncbi:succinate dehydrogenase, cytochrome b556 subunit [Phaeovibrio sulfidiphilus]|uniref:Succinate dehydrogenase cytochrome b556 subunit n=1 Tax=Phaeovibrio sulfidiphilus TaxID=1220600 RepID=A0A8J7CR43_9PROT|nr:succinate dehydrogenase, cytochrome b556 subunit [Phaeovibrio sulfidiphilus]MBE1237425.1 succinate dehydrogenase, cytochrome b556 subunit [Phaeovibrio sulfidiphilus]